MLKLTKPLVHLDIESTGLDPQSDAIVSFAAIKEFPANEIGMREVTQRISTLVKPWREIPAEATAIHGITNEAVASERPFTVVGPEIHAFIKDCDLAGFGLLHFDAQILFEEFCRANIDWDVSGIHMVDSSIVYKKQFPRDLTAAYKQYTGGERTGAHEAAADAEVGRLVLAGQVGMFFNSRALASVVAGVPQPDSISVQELADYSALDRDGSRRVDLAGVIIQDKKGVYRYTHKKVRGVAVEDDPGYGEWVLRNNFPTQTHRIVKRILDDIYKKDESADEELSLFAKDH